MKNGPLETEVKDEAAVLRLDRQRKEVIQTRDQVWWGELCFKHVESYRSRMHVCLNGVIQTCPYSRLDRGWAPNEVHSLPGQGVWLV